MSVKVLVVKMTYGYDKPLHAPTQLKTMESPPRELNEEALDASIADILRQEKPAVVTEKRPVRAEFPMLQPQELPIAQEEAGLGSVLRQKWAQLSGAA